MSGAVRRGMRGGTAEQTIRRRDAAGKEMEILREVMNDPNPDPKVVSGYIRELLVKEHLPPLQAAQIMASVPRDPDGLRQWARMAFSVVMHQGIHGHAAFPRELYPSAAEAPASPAATTNGNGGPQPGQPPQVS